MTVDDVLRNSAPLEKPKTLSFQISYADWLRWNSMRDELALSSDALLRGILLTFLDQFESQNKDVV